VETGEIVDADILLNATLGMLTVCSEQCADRTRDIDIQNAVTHEAGHFLGLAHSNVSGATMESRALIGHVEQRTLADDDRSGLCAVYGDLDTASCHNTDFEPLHGFAADCRHEPAALDDAGSDGCMVRGARPASRPGGPLAGFAMVLAALALVRRRRGP